MSYGDNDNPRQNVFFIDQSVDDNLSEPMFRGHLDIEGLRMPAAFTGSHVGFTESATKAGTYNAVTYEGTAISLAVAAGQTCVIDPRKLRGCGPWLKLTSDGSEAADRTVEPIYANRPKT